MPCLPNGAAIGRTSAQALHPEQTETPSSKTELSSQQTAGTVTDDQRGFVKMESEGNVVCLPEEKMEGVSERRDARGDGEERQGEGKDGGGVL